MRIAICALSAVLLSGCSWLGGVNNVFGGHSGYANKGHQSGQYGQVNYGARGGNHAAQNQYGQNFGGGFPQQPQYGAPTEVTGQYGTHVANAGQAYGSQRQGQVRRKPKLRGSLSLGIEKSYSGDLLDFSQGVVVPSNASLNSNGDFFYQQNEGFSGSPTDGLVVTSSLSAVETSVNAPAISFDDVHSTPATVAAGLEYIVTPRTTVFANAGYTYSEGNEGGAVNVIGDVSGDVVFTGFVTNIPGPPNVQTRALRNVPIAQFSYDFSDLERYDLEVGARHYFDPILKKSVHRSISPFVGASIGASHFNELSFKSQVEILELHDYVVNGETVFGPIFNDDAPTEIYESEWVPTGQLSAGLEWQATPRTAIAFETGVRFEGSRDFKYLDSNGDEVFEDGDNNITVPFTIRGSYNF